MNNLMKELGLEAKPVTGAALQILFSIEKLRRTKKTTYL